MLWYLVSLGSPPRKGTDLFDFSALDQGSVVGAMQPPGPILVVQNLSHVGVMGDVVCHPGAEDEKGAGGVRTVQDLVGVRRARRPAGCVAGIKWMGAVLLDHGRLARKHVEELVLLFVPVSDGRPCPR